MQCKCNLRKRITKESLQVNRRDIYLDYSGTTKPEHSILAKIDRINRSYWGNPSSQNSRGVNLYNIINNEIDLLTIQLGIRNAQIYFDTSSSSIIGKIKDNATSFKILTTEIEHISLLERADITIKVDGNGTIDLKQLQLLLKNNKNRILIYAPVNHETGNIQPIEEIFKIAKMFNTPIIFDAVQTISRLELRKWLNYCHGFYYSGHKIHGLQGGAALILKNKTINFKLNDSTLPYSLYTGTFNTPGVVALLEATKLLLNNFNNDYPYIKNLHKEALDILKKIEGSYILESNINNAPGIINISIPIINNIEDLLMHLNRNGIHIGRLSACSGNIQAESHVLKAMGREKSRSTKSLRISFGKDSKRDDFYRLTSEIRTFISSYNR